MIGRILVSIMVLGPCVIALAMGNAENVLSIEGAFATVNLTIAVILLSVYFFRADRTLAFVHVAATWLILIYPQFAELSAGTIRQGANFYDRYGLWELVVANLVIATWLLVFTASYLKSHRQLLVKQTTVAAITTKTLVIAFLISCAALVYLYFRLGGIVATRAAFDEAFAAETAMEAHLVEYPLRAIPFYAIGACIVGYGALAAGWRRILLVLAGAFLAGGALIINNPLAASRSFLGIIAIGFLYLGALRKAPNNLRLLVIILVGLFGILPLDFGREALTFEDALADLEWSSQKVFLNDVFSTFESIPGAVTFVESHGTTLGQQLVGNLLFFVPRYLWPDKAIGSGTYMVETEHGPSVFSNVSCALPCEGLINFGPLGVILLAILLGIALGYLDKKHSQIRTLSSTASAFTLFYAFSIGQLFFLTRGDLLSPLALFASMCLAYVVLWTLTKKGPARLAVDRGKHRFLDPQRLTWAETTRGVARPFKGV